jgi:hypothetical protein
MSSGGGPARRPAAAGSAPRNWGARLHEISLRGVPGVVLENELLRITVLTFGAHIVEFNHKPTDLDYVWLTPGGVRGTDAVTAPDDVGAFFDTYPGGWQEVLPNGGAPDRYRGAPLAQHGEVVGLPWRYEVVEDDPGQVAIRFAVRTRRMPFLVTKVLRLRAGSARLEVEQALTNEAPVEMHAMWGQHLAFGAPFLRPGSRITLPDGVRVIPHPDAIVPPRRAVAPGGPYPWPAVPTPEGDTTDLSVVPPPGSPSDVVYLTGFRDGWYELRRPDGGAGVRVSWDADVLPYLWIWHEFGATVDYPWWGRAYVIGIEPFSSYPTNGLPEAVRNGSALTLGPHAARSLNWSIEVLA